MNETITKFIEEGYVIDINNIDKYEKAFENRKLTTPSENFWEGKKVLVTGISGFVGSHLAEKLISFGSEVHGIVRRRSVPYHLNIEHIRKQIELHTCDLSTPNKVNSVMNSVKPEVIFHLAAESFVPMSFSEPTNVVNSNINGTINLLESARNQDISAIQIAGSSEQYGFVKPEDCPITEETPFTPRSVYAITKIAKEHIANLYHKSYGIPAIVTRTFNHTGPRRGLEFVTASIVRQIAYNKKHGKKDIILGNTAAYRDFTDVRDIVRGYMLAAEKGKPTETYQFASGKAISIKDLTLLAMRIADAEMNIVIDPKRLRPAEVPFLLGDYSKVKREFGWEATIPLTATIKDMFDYFGTNSHYLKH